MKKDIGFGSFCVHEFDDQRTTKPHQLPIYATSSFDTAGRLEKLNDTFGITESISKFISGGIKTTLGLLGASVLAVIVGELWSIFK